MTAPEIQRSTPAELLRQLVLLLANVTVITALLVYFGWKRASVQSEALGIDEAVFGMTTQEYALRSVTQVVWLLLGVAIVGLIWLWLDRRLRAVITRPWARILPWLAILLGLILIAPAVIAFLPNVEVASGLVYSLLPAAAGAGVLLIVYSGRLWALRGSSTAPASTMTQLFAFLIAVACLFWTTSNYAEVIGTQLAAHPEGYVTVPVTVISDRPLHLNEPGVSETALDKQTYRYTGLKLLERIGDRIFLVSAQWQPGRGKIIVLTEQAGLRFEYGG